MGILKEECSELTSDQKVRNRSVRLPSISYEYKLDPSPEYDFTVQSRKFAIEAKTYVQLHWKRQSSTTSDNSKKYHHKKVFLCFPFLTIWRKHNDVIIPAPSLPEIKNLTDVAYELIGESLIMKEDHIQQIGTELPARAVGFPWTLSFCTCRDGFSLTTMYRKLSKSSSPVLIVIEDLKGRIFGAMASSTLRICDNYFGTSDCFLFTTTPEFKFYKWNGDNFYFVLANPDSLSFGSSEMGRPGLWLDCDLNKGYTEGCLTYGSKPLVPDQDFVIRNLECWTFN